MFSSISSSIGSSNRAPAGSFLATGFKWMLVAGVGTDIFHGEADAMKSNRRIIRLKGQNLIDAGQQIIFKPKPTQQFKIIPFRSKNVVGVKRLKRNTKKAFLSTIPQSKKVRKISGFRKLPSHALANLKYCKKARNPAQIRKCLQDIEKARTKVYDFFRYTFFQDKGYFNSSKPKAKRLLLTGLPQYMEKALETLQTAQSSGNVTVTKEGFYAAVRKSFNANKSRPTEEPQNEYLPELLDYVKKTLKPESGNSSKRTMGSFSTRVSFPEIKKQKFEHLN